MASYKCGHHLVVVQIQLERDFDTLTTLTTATAKQLSSIDIYTYLTS